MSLFDNARRMVGQLRSYPSRNPHKIREFTGKAARFADQRTKGKYHRQINDAVRKIDGFIDRNRGPGGGPHGGGPYPRS
jgi:hypothetical protein